MAMTLMGPAGAAAPEVLLSLIPAIILSCVLEVRAAGAAPTAGVHRLVRMAEAEEAAEDTAPGETAKPMKMDTAGAEVMAMAVRAVTVLHPDPSVAAAAAAALTAVVRVVEAVAVLWVHQEEVMEVPAARGETATREPPEVKAAEAEPGKLTVR